MTVTGDARRVLEVLSAQAARRPGAAFLLQDGERLDYAGALEAVRAMAGRMAAAGLRAGDRVMIVAENSIPAVIAVLAAQSLDAWPAMGNPRLPVSELQRLRERIEPRFALFDAGRSAAAAERARDFGARDWGGDEGLLVAMDDPDAAPEPVREDAAGQVGVIIFTSGTTGTPKAVMHSHASLISLGRGLAEARRTGPDDTVSGVAPIAHIMGLSNVMAAMVAGAALRMQQRLSVAEMAAALARGEMTHLSFVPVVYAQLCEHVAANGIDLSGHQVKYMSCAGAPLVQALKDRVEALFGVPLANAFGMTECAPGTRALPVLGSTAGIIGFAEPGTEVAVFDAGRRPVPNGETGQLMVRGRGLMMGYYRDPEATAATLGEDGWLATGDIVRQLPDGSLEMAGRAKEMIIRDGFNVYPAEVEAAIARLPGVLHAAVVGVPEGDGNEAVVAFVQPVAGCVLEPEAIGAALRDSLAAYKRPSRIVLRESMPIGATGKILKRELVG